MRRRKKERKRRREERMEREADQIFHNFPKIASKVLITFVSTIHLSCIKIYESFFGDVTHWLNWILFFSFFLPLSPSFFSLSLSLSLRSFSKGELCLFFHSIFWNKMKIDASSSLVTTIGKGWSGRERKKERKRGRERGRKKEIKTDRERERERERSKDQDEKQHQFSNEKIVSLISTKIDFSFFPSHSLLSLSLFVEIVDGQRIRQRKICGQRIRIRQRETYSLAVSLLVLSLYFLSLC